MANSLSAKKRIRQNTKRRAINRWRKTRVRGAMKDYHELILHGSVEDAATKLRDIYKLLDKVAASGTIHRNAAARQKSRLATQLNAKRSQAA